MPVPARVSRQEGLAPFEKLQAADCVVIGVGAVGKQVLSQIVSMGVKSVDIWDSDTVDEVNLAPQGYGPTDLGFKKVLVCKGMAELLNPEVEVTANARNFANSDWKTLAGKYVFSCVDSIETRGRIYKAACKAGALWFGDCRVAGESVRVLSQGSPAEGGPYEKTLFTEAEAAVGACSTKMTIYSAMLAASSVVCKFAQNLRGLGGTRFTDNRQCLVADEIDDMTINPFGVAA